MISIILSWISLEILFHIYQRRNCTIEKFYSRVTAVEDLQESTKSSKIYVCPK